jgi:autotransporter-associated beta strand protein
MHERGNETLLLPRQRPAPAATTPTVGLAVAIVGMRTPGGQNDDLPGKATARLGGRLRHIVLALLALCAVLAAELPTPAHAATRTWTGAGPDNNWTTAANWSGTIAPSEGDDLVFPDSVTKTTAINTFASGTTFSSISFSGSRYTVGGNRFVLLNGIAALNPTLGNTIGVEVELARDQTFVVQSPDASLLISAGVQIDHSLFGGSPTGMTLRLDGAGTNDLGPLLGSGTLRKTGTGTSILRGASLSYLGQIHVEAGTLRAFTPTAHRRSRRR